MEQKIQDLPLPYGTITQPIMVSPSLFDRLRPHYPIATPNSYTPFPKPKHPSPGDGRHLLHSKSSPNVLSDGDSPSRSSVRTLTPSPQSSPEFNFKLQNGLLVPTRMSTSLSPTTLMLSSPIVSTSQPPIQKLSPIATSSQPATSELSSMLTMVSPTSSSLPVHPTVSPTSQPHLRLMPQQPSNFLTSPPRILPGMSFSEGQSVIDKQAHTIFEAYVTGVERQVNQQAQFMELSSPAQVRRRSKPATIGSTENLDPAYQNRRASNNLSAKKSRDKKRQLEYRTQMVNRHLEVKLREQNHVASQFEDVVKELRAMVERE